MTDLNNSGFTTRDSWAVSGRHEFIAGGLRLYPGASAKRYAYFSKDTQFQFGAIGTPNLDLFLNGALWDRHTKQSITIYKPPATGVALLEIKQNPNAASYAELTRCVHSVDSWAIPILMQVSPGTLIGPGAVTFSDISPSSATSWLWDFGDGTTSDQKTVTRVYVEEGEHIVTLTTNRGVMNALVIVQSQKPISNFSPGVLIGTRGVPINFTNDSWQATSWLWDFGDGATSTEQNPSHSYATNGVYTITLTAINAYGQHSVNKTMTIAAKPIPNFSASPVQGLTVQFSDLSLEDPTSWSWDFGENEKTLQNPVHSYQQPGTYNVTLTATNAMGSQPITKSIPVTVSEPVRPEANFSYQPTESNKTQIEFTDTSSNAPSSWLWSFGDGTTSTEQNPVHQYSTGGVYSVRLTVTNANGNATVSKTISVITPGTTPPTSGTVTPGTAQAGRMVSVVVTGTGFKPNARIRVTHGGFRGTVSKVKSFTSTRIEFSFCFESWFIGSCGVMISNTDGSTIVIPDCITVTE